MIFVKAKGNTKSNLRLNYLIDGILIQSFLQILLISITHSGLFPEVDKPYVDNLIGVALIINMSVFILVLLNIRRLKMAASQETIIEQQKENIDTLGKLVETIQQQKHDFLNHLQVIGGFSELNNQKEIKKYVKEVADQVKPQFQYITLNRLELKSLLYVKASIAKDSKINFKVTVENDFADFPLCKVDAVNLIGNLINNAFAASGHSTEPRVEIYMGFHEDYYTVKVYNNGATIPLHLGEAIFHKGYTTKKTDGLGLYIVKSLVDSVYGTIEYVSYPEFGTEFIIKIPKQDYQCN